MPLSLLLSLGKRFGPLVVGAVGLIAVYFYWTDRTSTIEDLRKANIELEAQSMLDRASYELNLSTLTVQIKTTKDQVEDANDRYNDLEQTAAIAKSELEAKLEQRIKGLDQKITLLESIPTPETCDAAMDLIIDIAEKNPWPVK